MAFIRSIKCIENGELFFFSFFLFGRISGVVIFHFHFIRDILPLNYEFNKVMFKNSRPNSISLLLIFNFPMKFRTFSTSLFHHQNHPNRKTINKYRKRKWQCPPDTIKNYDSFSAAGYFVFEWMSLSLIRYELY